MRTERAITEALGEEHALNPSDLYNAALKTNLFGGYSKNQVDALLERAAEVLEALTTQNRELKHQSARQQTDLDKFHETEESLRDALVGAQKMSENIISAARIQAETLVKEACLAKAQAVFKVEELPDAIRAEIKRLGEARDRLRDDIGAVLESHAALLKHIPRGETTGDAFVREEAKKQTVTLQSLESTESNDPANAPNDEEERQGYVDI